ncbi:cupin domain-containing protein [Octadecabacter sp. 1_MG-2023]|uniref:cupin domain-containing protein n=1 Tax=unclassified Octadecabacter TaxID=196158 RepID=UPI001C087A46|nr:MULTISPECIES: cupin domain-containing protein [unclassified Octadecabacter]MBU2993424.1 cupin domain-containing protein [Octadecabacter sp. B2R22]MDO6733120.1 cupin domain-containing protein [Octadecabacter sp. 1_MG-2023]
MTADDIITALDLAPHPEGGYFRQTWVDETSDGRPSGTCIYFLLKDGEASHWHRVDAVEIWLHHSGAPLVLSISQTDNGPKTETVLGPNIAAGERPQGIVPKNAWQAARTTGDWTLVSCTVSPGFSFEGFILAEPDFDIP